MEIERRSELAVCVVVVTRSRGRCTWPAGVTLRRTDLLHQRVRVERLENVVVTGLHFGQR